MSPDDLERHERILNESRDSEILGASAIALAASEHPAALAALAEHLRQREFLARLDDLSDPSSDIRQLTLILRTLAQHPTPAVARLCERLYADDDFREIPSRINLVLVALAAVHPVTVEGADVFRASNAEGYAEVNGPLLLQNASPLALQVFRELIEGDAVEIAAKVQILRRSLLPRRTSVAVLEVCTELLAGPLATDVRDALVEALFDYQPRRWFGPVLAPPVPPPWESATTKALDLLLALGQRALDSPLSGPARQAVESTLERLRAIRQARPS